MVRICCSQPPSLSPPFLQNPASSPKHASSNSASYPSSQPPTPSTNNWFSPTEKRQRTRQMMPVRQPAPVHIVDTCNRRTGPDNTTLCDRRSTPLCTQSPTLPTPRMSVCNATPADRLIKCRHGERTRPLTATVHSVDTDSAVIILPWFLPVSFSYVAWSSLCVIETPSFTQ